jgi:hypothetical protein
MPCTSKSGLRGGLAKQGAAALVDGRVQRLATMLNSHFEGKDAAGDRDLLSGKRLKAFEFGRCDKRFHALTKKVELPRPLLKYARQASLVEQPMLPGLGRKSCLLPPAPSFLTRVFQRSQLPRT